MELTSHERKILPYSPFFFLTSGNFHDKLVINPDIRGQSWDIGDLLKKFKGFKVRTVVVLPASQIMTDHDLFHSRS
jgi:hypothetical protein